MTSYQEWALDLYAQSSTRNYIGDAYDAEFEVLILLTHHQDL